MAKLGRPSGFSPDIMIKTRDYLDCYKDVGLLIPTKAGLAVRLNVPKTTVSAWIKSHPDFAYLMSELEARQEADLIQGGLSGEHSPGIVKLILHRHGYSDKQDIVQHTTIDLSNESNATLRKIISDESD